MNPAARYDGLTATLHGHIVPSWKSPTTGRRSCGKGVLELCILNIIGCGRVYGYDIVRQLRDIDALVVREGTIYPILSRLKRDALVRTSLEESPAGPARKYLRANPPWPAAAR